MVSRFEPKAMFAALHYAAVQLYDRCVLLSLFFYGTQRRGSQNLTLDESSFRDRSYYKANQHCCLLSSTFNMIIIKQSKKNLKIIKPELDKQHTLTSGFRNKAMFQTAKFLVLYAVLRCLTFNGGGSW